jgi:hypothetical protein
MILKRIVQVSAFIINFAISSVITCTIAIPGFAQVDLSSSLNTEIPEEVLRAEIYTEARSPLDGQLLSAREYLELQEELSNISGETAASLVSPKLRELIELLKLRRTLRQFIPFIR